ncbi:MAG TPA: hypothetical protein VFS43_19885 [Polyangiaceae bacterium]|nr:hypothetical protein [Polyangiaceae bacterium]
MNEALDHIRNLWTQGLLSTVVSLGDYIIEKFYGGDVREARSQRPHKPAALSRLLARKDELPISAHALKQAVRISVQYRELPPALAERLSKTQHEALLPVADVEQKRRLAEQAVEQQWSGRQLAERANSMKGPHAGGRPMLPPPVRYIGAVLRVLEAPEFSSVFAPSTLNALPPPDVEKLLCQVRRARGYLDRVGDMLTRQTHEA